MRHDRFAACEVLVRKADYDRYLASLFARAAKRPQLFALYAFNYEIAKTAESVSQPIAGQMRLQWWRDALDAIYSGHAPNYDVAPALGETIRAHKLPRALFDAMIDARENDLVEVPFSDTRSLETYADATSGHLMRLAVRILGGEDRFDRAAHEAGLAYALAGLLRALPFHAARRHLMLPVTVLAESQLSPQDIFAGKASPALTDVIAQMANRAHSHLAEARTMRLPRAFLPAILPATLVPLYLRALTRRGFNPFRDAVEIPVYRRQVAMLGAMFGGSV